MRADFIAAELQSVKDAGLYRQLRLVDGDQGATLTLDGREVGFVKAARTGEPADAPAGTIAPHETGKVRIAAAKDGASTRSTVKQPPPRAASPIAPWREHTQGLP